jgi:hypothetical protein
LLQLKNVQYGTCLDSNATDTGPVFTRGCNTGDYQIWEIFRTVSGGTTYFTFKSWGAWTLQGRHRCIATEGTNAQLHLAVCDTTNQRQQWS